MTAIDPITGLLIDTSKQILVFGLSSNEETRILNAAGDDCKLCKCYNYTDLIAYQGFAIIINSSLLSNQELKTILKFFQNTYLDDNVEDSYGRLHTNP